ncbi:Histone-lysine N-methyltransferase SMYD3 (SET and MYND domain-containing protein 3) (Zinc finger MYND domain-containing protein 1) [Durusdinium trenchii]|uniref:Histone-lysine N-methyltransferase SMYD3 (SET and MYND domain-containing protein 3) (Zinc finger MYND domain-containing protein 1) n=1 Tax=Durusdinium trenchii TaxID=1381693 RepID=A0ABP0R9J3_9DINO
MTEKQDAGCGYINDYCQQRHRSVVRCEWTATKGRILRSSRSFKQGEIIFREPPLHIVSEQTGHRETFERVKELCKKRPQAFVFEPLWYWAALCSLKPDQVPKDSHLEAVSEDTQKKLLLLYSMEVSAPSEASKVLAHEFRLERCCEPLCLERLLQVWILNCFEHTDDPLGYSTYFMSSFMSHSCYPNAVWTYDGDDFILRAREKIEVDEEITVSYLGEESMLDAASFRRKHLRDSKHFLCCCIRCSSDSDPCRGFRCPSCSNASLRLGACQEQVEVGAETMTFRKCEHCGHALSFGEAAVLIGEETLLKEKVEEMEGATSPDKELIQRLSKSLRRAEKSLEQHCLLDRSYQLMADLHERFAHCQEAEKYMRKRLRYQAKAYPGISGCVAWTAEAYADMLMKHAGASLDPVTACHSAERIECCKTVRLGAFR